VLVRKEINMKKSYFIRTILMMTLMLAMTACDKDENKVTIKEPGKTITVIDETVEEESKPTLAVERIDRYDKVNITDWIDENTVIVARDNESLNKLSLAELSERYPISLYRLDLTSKEFGLIKEQEEVFLGGASLSRDKKFLLYSEYSLGDPTYHILNLDTMEDFGIAGDPIGGAVSAKWADNEAVIGAAYSGGAYLADRAGKITLIEGLKDEALFLVEKMNESIYYNTQYDYSLMKLDLNTNEKVKLNLDQVFDILPSPDGKQMIVLQAEASKNTMLVYDLESGEKIKIAEGAELSGESWSPDQRRIAYSLKEAENNITASSLYVYDMLTGESTQIAVDIDYPTTSWSPSGEKLAYTEYDGAQYNSSIIHLK
jgi:TolB protein